MKKEILDKYNEWLNEGFLTSEDKEILLDMSDEEVIDAFYKDLEFGTAGIRGIMGVGTNRINIYNIKKVTLGLSNYLNKKYNNPSVVIGYDTRNNSREYAFRTALVLNKQGIKTYIFKDVTSTPEVSFAVRYLNTNSGIMITSSHNSKEYNGYKVFNDTGSQIVSPMDKDILEEINKIRTYNIDEENLNNELFNYIDPTIDAEFLKENEKVLINTSLLKNYSNKLKVTYTSFHGVGIKVLPFILEKYGIRYNLVNEQCKIDPNFTYAPNPNPEYEYNFDLAKKYAKELNSDVIISTDPDADRFGVLYKVNDGYKMLDGNMIGSIMLYYLLNNKKIINNNYVVRSIVTSNLVDRISNYYNANVKEVLTGCKNIAKEKNKDEENYLFGFEESLGYMFNIGVNDKNSFSSCLFFIEILCYLKSYGITLEDYIEEIFNKFGYYENKTISVNFDGEDGIRKMNNIMNFLRTSNILNSENRIDYLNRDDDLKTNALKFIVNEDEYFMVRPSGTEAKIKLYFFSRSNSKEKSIERINNMSNLIVNLIKDI
ncbi:MAG: phospho-sugar mutase [Bacilli bacterium]|nr:phospho-sugar mutase [Bacilli bacterium]